MRINRILIVIALTISLASVMAVAACADSFDVSLNTSSLSGTQILVFGFTDGDGVADNSATITNFNFGGGAAQGSPTYFGTDTSDFSSLFYQSFTVGSSLSFLLNVTDNFAGGTPDAFAMSLCAADFSQCYSDDFNSGADLVLNIPGTALTPSSFILNPASLQNLPAPVVTAASSSVPEPSAALLLCAGLAFFALLFRANK